MWQNQTLLLKNEQKLPKDGNFEIELALKSCCFCRFSGKFAGNRKKPWQMRQDKVKLILVIATWSSFDPLAQLAEHLTFNQGVPRSSRGWVTICGTLEKRLNSPAFHAGIHGFESRTCHQFIIIQTFLRKIGLDYFFYIFIIIVMKSSRWFIFIKGIFFI